MLSHNKQYNFVYKVDRNVYLGPPVWSGSTVVVVCAATPISSGSATMVYFPKLGPVSRRRKVEDQLDRMALLFVAKALYHLFKRTVESLLANKYV
jgi:hypothetical protein